MLEGPVVTGFLRSGGVAHHFVITGTGSSEGHARYLACLLNRFTPHRAEFRHLSSFSVAPEGDGTNRDLVVFSQGLSPNARLAIGRAKHFRQAFVFTAATEEGARESGGEVKANLIRELRDDQIGLFHYPLENEYTTLLRLVGPLAGYLAAVQFADSLADEKLPTLDRPALLDAVNGASDKIPADLLDLTLKEVKNGFHLVAPSPLSEFGQNLSYKFMEGLFIAPPSLWDILQFAHGPFQENCAARRPVIFLAGSNGDPMERDLFARARQMIGSAGDMPHWILSSSLPPVYRIFEYEMLLNHFLLRLLERTRISQVDWPGKGLDEPIYELGRSSALSSQ